MFNNIVNIAGLTIILNVCAESIDVLTKALSTFRHSGNHSMKLILNVSYCLDLN